ncbi:MAG: FecR domain-containing protein [Candidatus Wallbacteria bacterium]|nr:FecR domain-containing protein [Candidatus Wallbacteria bacterium]
MRLRFLAAAILLLAWAPAGAQQAGKLTELKGLVNCKPADATGFRAARVGDTLRVGDFLSTDFDSEATIGFPDGTNAKLLEMSQVRVNDIFLSGDASRLALYLRLGRVETLSPQGASGRTGFSVATPTATAWIRGTHQLVAYADGFGTDVQFLRGFGFTQSVTGRGVQQAAGQRARVGGDRKLVGPNQVAKQSTVANLTARGRDDDEVRSATEYHRLSDTELNDPLSPYALIDLVTPLEEPSPKLRLQIQLP